MTIKEFTKKIIKKIEIEPQPGSYARGLYSNRDLDPVPLKDKRRKWAWPSVLGFWVAEAFSISMYQVASSAIASGLNPGLAIFAIILGHMLVCIPAMLNAYIGATRGINFPITMRYTFGTYGALIGVAVRGMVALIWFGTQSYQGGQCVQAMIEAIWPSFKRFPNHLPESSHVTSAMILCFFLFIIIQIPLLYLNINQLRHMFTAKTIILPIFGLVLFLWAAIVAKGFGPSWEKQTKIVDGTPTAVIFFRCMISAIGPKATLALNITDFTRFAKSPKQVIWPQAVGLCVLVTLCGILGIVVTECTTVIYGVKTWNPLQVAELWDNRAAKFFNAACWAFAVIGTNISANTVSFSNDLSLWFPKWINARRGAYICCVVAIATNPWQIQANAKSFTAFLGGYSVFLGPIAGIMCTDYYLLRKQVLDVPGLYHHPGPFTFYHGFNIPAFLAFIFGITPNLPGLAAACGNKNIPTGAIYLYSFSWVTGTCVAAITYYLMCHFMPWLWRAGDITQGTKYDPKELLEDDIENIDFDNSVETIEGVDGQTFEKNGAQVYSNDVDSLTADSASSAKDEKHRTVVQNHYNFSS